MAIARTDLQIPGFAVNTAPDGFNPVRDLPAVSLLFTLVCTSAFPRVDWHWSSSDVSDSKMRGRGKNLAIGFPRKLFGTDGGLSCQRGARISAISMDGPG